MKNLLVLVAVLTAVSVFSAEFNSKTLWSLYKAKNYAQAEAQAIEMKSSAKTDVQKGQLVQIISTSRRFQKKYANLDAALADVDALVADMKVSANNDSVQGTKINTCVAYNNLEKAAQISETWTGRMTSWYRSQTLYKLGRYTDAMNCAVNAGYYVYAIQCAKAAKLPEKVFEYAQKAFAESKIQDPVVAISTINYVIEANYAGTTVTPAKVKELLQLVNRKYSRKLVVNNPTKWDELITIVRQTLETY